MTENNIKDIITYPARGIYFLMFMLFVLLPGCSDPVTSHSVKNFFFDGVPALPTLDKLCEANMEVIFNDYYESRISEALDGAEDEFSLNITEETSFHPPFKQKKCKNCHDFTKPNLLLLPPNKLCFKCHIDFIKGSHVHGPVAVADCLACHFPHQSPYTSLLRRERTSICGKCHQEKRLAANMHVKVIDHGMACVDCHDPHSGDARYFLK